MTTCSAVFVAVALLLSPLVWADNYAIVIDTSENMKGNRLTAVRQVTRVACVQESND
jgi:hypothetical protein